MKGRINKIVSFFVVVGLIISMAVIKNATTIKMSKQNLEVQPVAAAPIGHINNFMQRFYTYDALIGKDASESVWTFWDTEKKEANRIKNVYCVQTGKSANNNTPYDIYDAYNIDEATIKKYFGDAAHYRHFLYILENMFLVGRTGSDRQYMINSTNAKLNNYYSGSNYGALYNNMIGEVNGLDMAGNYNGRVDAKYSGAGNENIQFNVWSSLTGSPVYNTYTDPINRVDNYLAIIQRYLLLSNVKQKDTNNYGTNPVSAGYRWNFFKAVYPYGYKSQGTVGGNSQKYADGLLKMLDQGFNNDAYDINKYKNFNPNNTYVNTENAVYDSSTRRAGPFTVVNPNGYSITPNTVKFGNENKSFTVVDADGSEVTLSSKTTGTDFYIQLDDTLDNSNALSINFYIDFGDVTTARLLIPTKANGQLMATVDRKHQDKNNTWTTKIEVKPDIALKKYIYAVNGSVAAVPARINDIDLTPLANATSTNANYNMNKTPVKVQVGDTVTYAIQLFNEGRVNGTADEIIDYLPSNLTFVRAYTDFDAVHAPGYDGSKNITNIGSNDTVKLPNPNTDYIAPYEDSDTKETFMAKSQIIYIDCKVGVSGNGYVYTNMAEISKYRMEAGSDVDSTASNWNAPSQDRASQEWQDYSNGHSSEDPSWFDNGFHNWGAQDNNGAGDDDDFDKIIIDHIDLALTKRIEGKLVDGTEEYLVPDESSTNKSRIEISGYDEVKNGTASDLRYNMNKKVAHVQKEDQLVTVLTVYNEGKIDGLVKEITDYVPSGLNYNATETTALNSSNTIFTYNSQTRELKIQVNGNDGISLQNLNDYDNDPSNHKVDHFEVKIVFDVSKAASSTIYNSAAITDYGYVGNDNNYYDAKELGVDKDSHGNENGDTLTTSHKTAHGGAAAQPTADLTQYDKNDLQFEDDDDMDLVEVDYNPNFDLSLRKYIQKVEKKFDVPIDESDPSSGTEKYSTVYENRIPKIDEFSVRALNTRQTAEYFHDKLRVVTENGDLVTYRIRVYNEGKDDDCYGRATEITDYLPSGLEFVSLENGNDIGWTASCDGNKIVLSYSEDKKLPTNSIDYLAKIARVKEIKERIDNGEDVSAEDMSFYNTYGSLNEHNFYQEVGVICRVTANEDFKIITNRAAITEREAYKKVYDTETEYHLEYDSTIQDRDNSENDELYSNDVDAMHNSLDTWYRTHVYNETTPVEYYPGDEDDDDFDSLYVYNYNFKIQKTDGTDLLPGATMKVIKYRATSEPRSDYYSQLLVEKAQIRPQTELTAMESDINTTGEGAYKTTAPVSEVENDVYIIKEITAPDGYYNPFEDKYIKVSFRGVQDEVHTNFSFLNMYPLYTEVYEDNGDDDYTNDRYIVDNFRDPYNIYKYVSFSYPGIGREFELKIRNIQIEEVYGQYTVRLTKYGVDGEGNEEQIAGVQFDAEGKFNGGNFEAIPSAGNKLESLADDYVLVIPDSYTSGNITIDPDTSTIPDEINIEETGIRPDAVDGEGHPINMKYYTGLLGKVLNIKVNKKYDDYYDGLVYKRVYKIDTLDTSLDTQSFTGEIRTENGSKIKVTVSSGVIDIKMYNPAINPTGDYTINLSKTGTDAPNTLVPGIEFEASGMFNETSYDVPSHGNNLITGTQPVNIMPANMNKVVIDPESYQVPDYITLKEKGFSNTAEGNAAKAKYYLALKDKEIKVIINKDVNNTDPMNPVYYVSSIGLTVDGSSANITGSGYSWSYTDSATGAKVEVSYNTSTRNINVKVTNPEKEGSFKINLKKYKTVDENNDGNYDPLQGAVFNVTVNDGTSDIKTVTNQTTNANGEIPTISGIDITNENLTYTITVTEVSAPEGYIGLGTPVTFTAKSKSDGSRYVLDTSVQPTISNNYVQAEVSEDEILIEAENRVEPIIHKGVKTVENQDSGYDKNEIQTWVINTTVPTGIADYTKYIVTDTIDPDKSNVNEKRIAFLNEANPANNVVVKYKGTNTVLTEGTDYKASFDTATKKLTITFINATSGNDNFVGGRRLTEDTVLEITYKTQFTLDSNGNPIGLNQRIPNTSKLEYNANGSENKEKESETPEVHTGGLGVYKYDKSTNQALAGAKFRLVRTAAEAEEAVDALWSENQAAINAIDWVKKYNADGTEGEVWEVTTGSDGYAYFAGLEFGKDAKDSEANRTNNGKGGSTTYEYNWETASTTYYLVETYVPDDYILLDEVAAECEVKKDSFVITDLTTYHKVGNEVVVPEGEYGVEIVKYGRYQEEGQEKELHPIAGVIFSAKRTVNGGSQENLGNLTATDSTGRALVGDTVVIDKDHVTTNDEYIIKEESVPADSVYYVGLTKKIKLTVSKQSVKSDDKTKWINSVTGINMTIEGETVTEVVAGKKYTATVVKDGQSLDVTAELVEDNGQLIKLTVENPHKVGKFPLHLVKTIKGTNPIRALANAGFKISIKKGNEYVTDKNGRAIDGTYEYKTDGQGNILIEDINITRPGETYDVEIEETTVPAGYIGIPEEFSYTVTSVVNGNTLTLESKDKEDLSNDVQVEVKNGEIWNYVENKPEPEIHKGVKTVENQDSGYDGDEVQTWVINTTVPTGIADYTKYIVTDTIDPDKSNVNEKRIAFLNEANPANNVVVKYKGTNTVLTEGTDYKASFDTATKKLTITFINATSGNDNFVGGRRLTEDTVLEITYKTQFTLDSNGNPIGLNQRIPNTSKLEYNANGSENKEKESETPEVHTGGLGVYKYDKSTNQALAGAKFRLVRTAAEAEEAVDALWSENQAAINAIDWVKKYNADGTEGEVWEVTTGSDGYAYFAGLEFGKDAKDSEANRTNNGKGGSTTYEYNWETASTTYYLVETYVPDDYILLDEVAAECEVKKDSFVITDLTTYHKVGNEVVVPEGEYGVEIVKYGRYQEEGQEKELHPIAGVIFSAKRTVNGGSQENLGNLTATDSTGRALVGDTVVIDKDHVTTNDEYIIKEESVPADSVYYVGLTKKIKLTVSKQSVKSDDKTKWINSVTGINMTIEGETVTEVVAGKKYTATVVKDGQSLDVTAELVEDNGQLIKLTVENPHKVGKFPLHLVKTIKGTNPIRALANAGFKISIKKGNEYVTDKNGRAIDGTYEYKTDGQGNILIEDINITRPGETYDVEIEETTVPAGYIGIPEEFSYTVTSVVNGNTLTLESKDKEDLSNDVQVEVKNGEIWNYVENKPEPEIHKGVKTVENQDSGYDGDEVQTWVINTTVPAGIGDYTKYIVTDTIDPEKTNNNEKRIEFLGLNTIHVYVKGTTNELVQGEDYLATFDDTTKTITLKFIDGEFKKGQELPENSIIEITFNTKFRLDSNGLIIGLNQSIPNQAHLTFNGNGKVDGNKHSETPEVHTGAVGVVKYEDINKNGEFDSEDKVLKGAHFKIVRSEEEARRALKAVRENDEATLRTINFVKVRDAEGNPTATDVELVTGEDGTATYEGLEFGEDAKDKSAQTSHRETGAPVYEYNWETAKTDYYMVETVAPEEYYLLDHVTKFEVSKNSFVRLDLSTYYKEANKPKVYDLSLRKFITHVNGVDRDGKEIDRNITDRIPRVTLTDEFKDKNNDKVTTAIYEHTKDPVIVQQGNIVTYTIRVYNEGPEDAYASLVKDDIPDGVKFIPYAEGDGSINDEYRWKLVDENDNEVSDINKAKYIVTDYLSMEQGEVKDGVNENLLKGFDSDTMTELDYRDLKVQFLVVEPNTSERIITNYAQISDMTNSKGNNVKDRDSTPNEWINGEDDQDIENIRLLYFDLALRKWVTKAIVTTDGEQKVYETGHKAEDDPEAVVKVDLKKSKLDKVVVKFEYQIRITNQGRIGGWCEEVTDHIPDGLVFDQADNPIWTPVNDKTIVTDALKDTYLEPGESAEVTVVLRWVNSGDNLGIKVNVAEISKDRNEYGVHDIDSTPGNYKWGEDDIDDAPVMLAITTGNRVIGYVTLGLVVVSIIAVGAIAIKKVRNEKEYF